MSHCRLAALALPVAIITGSLACFDSGGDPEAGRTIGLPGGGGSDGFDSGSDARETSASADSHRADEAAAQKEEAPVDAGSER